MLWPAYINGTNTKKKCSSIQYRILVQNKLLNLFLMDHCCVELENTEIIWRKRLFIVPITRNCLNLCGRKYTVRKTHWSCI